MPRSNKDNNFFQVVAKNFDVLALPLVTLIYPLYASIRAIETRSLAEDQQWLTYWVLYSLITLFEMTFAKLLECFPIWPYAKLVVTCWLVMPQFNGASYVYRRFIRPFYMDPQATASKLCYIPRKNIYKKMEVFRSKPKPDEDILTAAERYIQEHGSEPFERMINRAEREERAMRSTGNYTIFDDDYMY